MPPALTEKLRFLITAVPSKERQTSCASMGESVMGAWVLTVCLPEFLGKEGLDLGLREAEVKGFGDDLVDRGPHLLEARVLRLHGRAGRDVGPDAAARLDDAVALEVLIDLG